MSGTLQSLGRGMNVRPGEGRLLAALTGFLFLTVAAETFLSSARNGLFLSVFDPRWIPHVMVGSALLSAAVAVGFSAVMARFRRRVLAVGLIGLVGIGLVGAFVLFRADERSSFVIYLAVQAVEVLLLTHAWDYMGDLLTGRQAKRLLPLAGVGGSVAAILAGSTVGPLAFVVTQEGILPVAALLLVGSLGFLWITPEPARDQQQELGEAGAAGFLDEAGRGFRTLRAHALLRLVALATVLLVATSTLIDLQWKIAVQARFEGAGIVAAFGVMEAAIGVGALLLQLLAARVLFPRLGISGANVVQAGSVGLAAIGFAVTGSFWPAALLRFLDEASGDSIEKPAMQVSLLPFPPRSKNAAFTTLDGVLRPLARAAGAGVALILAARFLPWLTVALAAAGLLVLTGHRRRYLWALEEALSRHRVDLQALGAGRLRIDPAVIEVLDRFLEDDDPTVVVFALSMLKDLSPRETLLRTAPLLDHPTPEVRMEAARTLGASQEDPYGTVRNHLTHRLEKERNPDVIGALLVALGSVGEGAGEGDLGRFLEHPEPTVRRAALMALARKQPDAVHSRLTELLDRGGAPEREAALSVVGTLGYEAFLPAVTRSVMDDRVRTAALSALASFGAVALPALEHLLDRKDLPLPVRRSLVTIVAGVDDAEAREILFRLARDEDLGPAALTSLRRLRTAGRMAPLDRTTLRPLVRGHVERAARYALVGTGLERTDGVSDYLFVVKEMEELRIRHLHRVMAVLALGYDAAGLAKAERAIFSDDSAQRSNALEYLEGSLTQEDADLVVPLAEWERGDTPDALLRLTVESDRALNSPIEMLADDDRWWPRALARYALSFESGDDFMIPLIEKVMLLKGSELFRTFPGDELAGIAELAEERHTETGEFVFRQGDVGDAYYLVVRGAISIIRDGHELAVLGPREGFGEMAILDQDTRSASARAIEPTTLLSIDRDSFDQLIERNPAIARGIYRVLTQRLRNTLAQVAARS